MATGPYADLTVLDGRDNGAVPTLSGTPGLSLCGTIHAKTSTLAQKTGTTLGSLIIVNSATISGCGPIGVNDVPVTDRRVLMPLAVPGTMASFRSDDRRWVPPGGSAPNRRHDMANGS